MPGTRDLTINRDGRLWVPGSSVAVYPTTTDGVTSLVQFMVRDQTPVGMALYFITALLSSWSIKVNRVSRHE